MQQRNHYLNIFHLFYDSNISCPKEIKTDFFNFRILYSMENKTIYGIPANPGNIMLGNFGVGLVCNNS